MDVQHITGLTVRVLQELKLSITKDSRALRDFILNITYPEVYDFTLQRFEEMGDASFNTAVGILRTLREKGITRKDLEHVAQQIECTSDQSDSCLEMIGTTSVRVVVARKHVARVSTKHLGPANAMKRARWIRDNYLFDQKGSAKKRKPPTFRNGRIKRISLISDISANRFIFLIRYHGETGRPTTKQFSVIELGFDGAFRAALTKAREESPGLDLHMPNPYLPTAEEYAYFKQHVPDLPMPGEN